MWFSGVARRRQKREGVLSLSERVERTETLRREESRVLQGDESWASKKGQEPMEHQLDPCLGSCPSGSSVLFLTSLQERPRRRATPFQGRSPIPFPDDSDARPNLVTGCSVEVAIFSDLAVGPEGTFTNGQAGVAGHATGSDLRPVFCGDKN